MIEISQSQEQPPKSPSPPPETLYAEPISVAAPESEVVTLAKVEEPGLSFYHNFQALLAPMMAFLQYLVP